MMRLSYYNTIQTVISLILGQSWNRIGKNVLGASSRQAKAIGQWFTQPSAIFQWLAPNCCSFGNWATPLFCGKESNYFEYQFAGLSSAQIRRLRKLSMLGGTNGESGDGAEADHQKESAYQSFLRPQLSISG